LGPGTKTRLRRKELSSGVLLRSTATVGKKPQGGIFLVSVEERGALGYMTTKFFKEYLLAQFFKTQGKTRRLEKKIVRVDHKGPKGHECLKGVTSVRGKSEPIIESNLRFQKRKAHIIPPREAATKRRGWTRLSFELTPEKEQIKSR